jgi:predicted Zn-dependent protease
MPAISKLIVSQISFENEVKLAQHIPFDKHFTICSLTGEQSKALENFKNYLYPKNPSEKNLPLQIKVARLDHINAFTFPGGTIILLSGLLKEVKTPEELLSIIAHEMGHVIARDNFNFLVRSSIVTSFFAYLTGDFSSAAIINPQTMMSIMALSYDREMEMNADRFAINRLIELGISQKGMYDFFMRRKTETNEKIPEMVLTHPNFENRLKKINPAIGKNLLPFQLQEDFKIIKGICD